MEEAVELSDYLPLSFTSPKEGTVRGNLQV